MVQPAANKSAEEKTSELLLARILTSLKDDKAEDIVQINLRGKSSIGDYMIIGTTIPPSDRNANPWKHLGCAGIAKSTRRVGSHSLFCFSISS